VKLALRASAALALTIAACMMIVYGAERRVLQAQVLDSGASLAKFVLWKRRCRSRPELAAAGAFRAGCEGARQLRLPRGDRSRRIVQASTRKD